MSPDFTTPPAGAQAPSMTSRCGVHVTSHRQTCASELTARHLDIFAYSNWHEASRPLLSWHTKFNARVRVENRTVVMYARSCFFLAQPQLQPCVERERLVRKTSTAYRCDGLDALFRMVPDDVRGGFRPGPTTVADVVARLRWVLGVPPGRYFHSDAPPRALSVAIARHVVPSVGHHDHAARRSHGVQGQCELRVFGRKAEGGSARLAQASCARRLGPVCGDGSRAGGRAGARVRCFVRDGWCVSHRTTTHLDEELC